MAIEAERLLAVFEARFASLDKALTKARKDATGSFGAIEAAGTRAENTLANIGRRGVPGMTRMNQTLRTSRFETANVAAQFQDIGVQLASGQSPFLIAIQQGTQLNQVLGQAGARGALSLLGGAFASLLNPVSLATIAIIGLGGAAIQYFTEAEDGSEDVNKALKAQADMLRKVADAWGDQLPAVRELADRLAEIAERNDKAAATAAVIAEAYRPSREEIKALDDLAQQVYSRLRSARFPEQAVKQFSAAWNDLQEAIGNNTAKASDAQRVIDALTQFPGAPKVDALTEKIKALADQLARAAENATEANNQLLRSNAGDAFGRRWRAEHGILELPANAPAPDRRPNDIQRLDWAAEAAENATKEVERAAREAAEKIDRAIAGQTAVAVDAATKLLGKHERANAGDINAFLRAGGVDLNAATTAWCAAFVNSALAQVGITGSGSNVATDFLNWGVNVDPSQIQRGDVLVDPNGRSAGQTGGHVGFATGLVRFQEGVLQLQMLSGNASNQVQEDWVNAFDVVARRATDASNVSADALKHLGQENAAATRAAAAAARELARAEKEAESAAQDLGSAVGNAMSGLANAFADGKLEAQELLGVVFNLISAMSSMPGMAGSGFGAGLFSALFGGGIPGFANGTNSAPGGLAWVGERGRELVNLPRGSQVIPNHKIGGTVINMPVTIDATGADAAGLARLQRSFDEFKSKVPAQIDSRIRTKDMRGMRAPT